MSQVVLDASAGVELALNTVSGRRLARSIGGRDPWVPDVFYSEVAGVLRRMQLHGAVTAGRAEVAVDRLLGLRTRRVEVKPLIRDAWALRRNLTIPDAIYVVMARHLAAPLVTGDQRLSRAPAAALAAYK